MDHAYPDLDMIARRQRFFSAAAYAFWCRYGAGVVCYDITTRAAPADEPRLRYIPLARFDGTEPEGVRALVERYDPARELVVLVGCGSRQTVYLIDQLSRQNTPLRAFQAERLIVETNQLEEEGSG